MSDDTAINRLATYMGAPPPEGEHYVADKAPAAALIDEQTDGGFTFEGIQRGLERVEALWRDLYGDTRAFTDLIAAVIARAKREERNALLPLGRDGWSAISIDLTEAAGGIQGGMARGGRTRRGWVARDGGAHRRGADPSPSARRDDRTRNPDRA